MYILLACHFMRFTCRKICECVTVVKKGSGPMLSICDVRSHWEHNRQTEKSSKAEVREDGLNSFPLSPICLQKLSLDFEVTGSSAFFAHYFACRSLLRILR